MKIRESKWPVTITIEVADDWFDGIDKEYLNNEITEFEELKQFVCQWSDLFIAAKGMILALQEAKRKKMTQRLRDA